MPFTLIAAALLAGSAAGDSAATELVRRMHDRYDGSWPTEVTFVQTSTFYQGDSTRAETWAFCSIPLAKVASRELRSADLS